MRRSSRRPVGAAAVLLAATLIIYGISTHVTLRHHSAGSRPAPSSQETDPAAALASASPLPPAPIDYAPSAGCGVERQSLKVGRDAAARDVPLVPHDTTVQNLTAAPADLSPTRVAPIETTVWRLAARLVAYKGEADSDYHLVLADASGNEMIAEIASPSCDYGTAWPSQMKQARSEFDVRFQPTDRFAYLDVPVTIVGVGFFDFQHGQRGAAVNGVEIHPVLSITFG